jgi:hypothetical protein
VIATAALALALIAAPPTSAWTLAHARATLVAHDFFVVDESQPDRPDYDLSFARRDAARLRPLGRGKHGRWRRFAYSGFAHDLQTDLDVRVTFRLTTRDALAAFRGPPPDTSQPSFPIRAAFYYAWYPEAWTRDAVFPYSRFHPSLDYYSADDAHVVHRQTDAMRYAHLDAGIYSWWGESGYPPTDSRFWRYLAAARTTPFRWAAYYEREGYADPTVDQLHADLEYLRDFDASKPAYLKVDGRFVVFVYGDSGDSCATAARWHAANEGIGAYLVLKAFAGYLDCPQQPDAWHQYSGSRDEYAVSSSFMVSPGFDEAREPAPRLARDPTRFRQTVADMVASNAPWQLVISFNEWPEGTSIEAAREWQTASGYGAYLDALHEELPGR